MFSRKYKIQFSICTFSAAQSVPSRRCNRRFFASADSCFSFDKRRDDMIYFIALCAIFQAQQASFPCACDGIGRHAGFRFLCFSRVGSSPFRRTISEQSPLCSDVLFRMSSARFLAPPFQIEPACAGLRFGENGSFREGRIFSVNIRQNPSHASTRDFTPYFFTLH